MTAYRVVDGISWTEKDGTERRAEPGELVSDLPAKSVAWLLKDGHILKADDDKDEGG